MKKLTLLLALSLHGLFPIFAQQSSTFSPEIKRVAVFKNGFAFTYREGETIVNDGWAYSTRVPIGVLGTVWGYSTSADVKIKQLLAAETEKREIIRVTNIPEILIANEGARIRFTDVYDKDKSFEGTYQILSDNRKFERIAPQGSNELTIALKTQTGVAFFPVQTIRNLEILGTPTYDKPLVSKESLLKMNVEGVPNGGKTTLGIAALERGIRWIPAYRVEVKGTPVKQAKLELEAMIINELADLDGSEIYFVVGVPHFLFQDTLSPLSMNTAFAGVSGYFGAGAGNGRRDLSNAIMSQVSARSTESLPGNDGLPTIEGEEQTNSFSAEQLYLYQTSGLKLKKGERASQRLFSLTVPASEVFEWTFNDEPDTEKRYMDYGRNSTSVPITTDLSSKIWYALRLKNDTGMPWTTASALSFRDWKPLGQDMLTFTPVGGENILRVSPATEVIGTHTLEEKSRSQVSMKYSGSTYDFDLITVEGKIKIRNTKKEAVEVVLTRNLVGEVISAGNEGKFSREGFNLQAVNPNSIIKWNLKVPGGENEYKYSYKIYVRR